MLAWNIAYMTIAGWDGLLTETWNVATTEPGTREAILTVEAGIYDGG